MAVHGRKLAGYQRRIIERSYRRKACHPKYRLGESRG
jgi:hypothetical protein